MVKFGRHLQFYLESDETNRHGDEPYVVPYNDIKECIGKPHHHFTREWMTSLKQASDDYSRRTKTFWKIVFEDISSSSASLEEYRGIQGENAIELYVKCMEESRSRELFSLLKSLHNAAAMNLEALRKLVKKYDKRAELRGDEVLSSSFLQELYSSPFSSHQCLGVYIEILRDSLVESDEEPSEDEDTESDIHTVQQKNIFCTNDSTGVKRREMAWLKSMIASIPKFDCEALVAHRGFHCPRDGTNRRPLENSLSAFEMAWSGGIGLCECDIALTKDEKLVLAHDDDFSRLALEPNSTSSKTKVQDLTMKEIISLTFKSGASRPPLLLDVLRSAHAIGGNCRLVIEIKPGNQEACTVLVRLFKHHPELLGRCAVIMSFDGYIMHRLKSELEEMKSSFMTEGVKSSSPEKATYLVREDTIKLPQIMLLTVAREPKMHYELCLDIMNSSPIHAWLKHSNETCLDGVYLQYQSKMLEPAGVQALRDLSKQHTVGIWGRYKKDPDEYFVAHHLIKCGVSYVNTDLPRNFRGDPKQHRMTMY